MMLGLLVIIYIAFISLGLPDAIMGSAWPSIHTELGAQIALVGIYSSIVSVGTIISSIFSGKAIRYFGTGLVTAVSVLLTALGLIGISFSRNFFSICLFAVPLGIGAGAVDTALNNFVALHYKAKHMSWLHCFWGIGATAGPVIIALFLHRPSGWAVGYKIIAVFQFALAACLLLSLKLWKKIEATADDTAAKKPIRFLQMIQRPGALLTLLCFFCYCSAEMTVGIWGASYLVNAKGLSVGTAAGWVGFYYFAITVGRMITGFMTAKISNRALILMGQSLIMLGALVLLIPIHDTVQLIGLGLIGFGCAPVYPSMLHETPARFGKNDSQSMMGIQMASAYAGITIMPPLFGLIANQIGLGVFPIYLAAVALLMLIGTGALEKKLQKAKQE